MSLEVIFWATFDGGTKKPICKFSPSKNFKLFNLNQLFVFIQNVYDLRSKELRVWFLLQVYARSTSKFHFCGDCTLGSAWQTPKLDHATLASSWAQNLSLSTQIFYCKFLPRAFWCCSYRFSKKYIQNISFMSKNKSWKNHRARGTFQKRLISSVWSRIIDLGGESRSGLD